MRKKEQSNLAAPSPRRFTLPKSQILRGRRNFQRLFSSSETISSTTVNLRFATYPSTDEGQKFGFIAPKRIGNAVKRNQCKRLMREAFRLNKHDLIDTLTRHNVSLHAAFIAKHANTDFTGVQNDVVTLLTELRSRILLSTQTDESS